MKKLLTSTLLLLILCCNNSFSQNLVPNSSFETVTAEPNIGCEITNATGWLNPSGSPCPNNNAGTPDLFSTFSTGQADLPNSFMGTTNAHTGNRCSGLVTYHAQITNYREYLTSQLSCRMDSGVTYTISFWTTGGNPVQYIYHTNNIGLYFSAGQLTQTGYNLIAGTTPQIELTTLVTNSAWTYYTFTYTPNQSYSYLTLGNFRNDAATQTQSFGTNRPYSYYFFDDISIVPINGTTISLGNDTSYCSSFSRTLSTGNPATLWSTGITASQITVTTAGTYWASIGTGCGISSDSITITQNTTPAPFTLGNDTAYCGNFTRVLTTGNANTVWSTGVTAAQITVSVGGTYSASITNTCGTVNDAVVITQNPAPVVNLGNDTTLCTGQNLLLTAGNAGSTYLWQDNSNAATYNVSTAGIYSVTVINASGCSASDNINVTYTSGPPVVDIGNDTAYCGNFTRTLSTGNPSTIWSTGTTAAQIAVSSGGTYSASISNGCGTSSDAILLTQNALPIVTLGNDTTLCTGQNLLLNAGNAGSNYSWQDNSSASTYNVTAAGTYSVTVTNAAGCSSADGIDISYITGLPQVNIGNDTTYCGDFNRTISTSSITNALWNTGVTASQINVTTPGTYWAEVSNACGITRDSIVFGYLFPPVVSFGGDVSICDGDSLYIFPITTASSFLWSNGSPDPHIYVTEPGIYWYEGWDNPACRVRDSIVVSPGILPAFTLGTDTIVCGNQYDLALNIPNAQYLWQDQTTNSFYHVTSSGTYMVTVTTACGSVTDAVNVDIHADECALLIPTAFSPNGDGANDKFRAVCRCPVTRYGLHVYNRWGELVFETEDINEGWNGTFRDQAQPLSVYVYYIDYFNYCEQKIKKVVGNVTLVK